MNIVVPFPPVNVATPSGDTLSIDSPTFAAYAASQDSDEVIEFSRGSDKLPTIARLLVEDNGSFIRVKRLNIPSWNMVAGSQNTVAHGFSDLNKIVGIFVRIRNDANTYTTIHAGLFSGATAPAVLNIDLDATNVILTRGTGSFYDSVSYDDEAIVPRGNVYIFYII